MDAEKMRRAAFVCQQLAERAASAPPRPNKARSPRVSSADPPLPSGPERGVTEGGDGPGKSARQKITGSETIFSRGPDLLPFDFRASVTISFSF